MSMKLEKYENIMSVIESFTGRNYECEILLQQKFPDIMPETLRSIYELFYQKKMKKISSKLHRCSKDLYKRYKAAVENKEPVGILVRMSDEMESSPALLARRVVEEYYNEAIEEYITRIVDDSDNSGRCNANLRTDDSIRCDDTEYVLSDDNTENSSASTSNTDSKASDKVVEQSGQKLQTNSSTASLDTIGSPINDTVKNNVSKNAIAQGSKKRNKHTRGKHKVSGNSTPERSDTQTKPTTPDVVVATAATTTTTQTKPTTPVAAAVATQTKPTTPDVVVATAATTNTTQTKPTTPVAAAVATQTKPTTPVAAAAVVPPAAKEEECVRIKVSELIRDTTLIKDKDLAYEVFLCHVEDDQNGPAIDCYRQSLGHHYEVLLLKWVRQNGLTVQDEAALRKFGFDKTPDIKLDLPIAICGAPIMWIESKAIFADEEVHQTYYNNQYIRYWNRFGPGLVIYWLGYLETIATAEERRIMIRHDLPDDIKKYDPSCIGKRRFTEKPFGAS